MERLCEDKYIELDIERGDPRYLNLYRDDDIILKRILELYPEWEEYNIRIIRSKPSTSADHMEDYMDLLIKFTGPYPYPLTMNDGDEDIVDGEYQIFMRCKIFK